MHTIPAAMRTVLALVVALCCGTPALAAITPYSMDMAALSRSCITDCINFSNYAQDTDSQAANFGSFSGLSVATSVAGGVNSFAASASGTTSLNGTTGLSVHLLVDRPSLSLATGSYETSARTSFSFATDVTGGTMDVAYSVTYARPFDGPTLNTGINFSAPSSSQLFDGKSVSPTSFASLVGTSTGQWSFTLSPNTYYAVTLSAVNSTAFSSPPGLAQDSLDATFTVTLPSFAAAVPEPSRWAVMLSGLAMMVWTVRRKRVGAAA